MCFSATASFATGAILIPAGIATLSRAASHNKDYLPLAVIPLVFGVQQLFEGVLWLSLEGVFSQYEAPAMFGFLFFAILLWPAWVPLSVWRIEKETVRRRVFAAATLVGLLFGSLLYFPLLLEPTRVSSVISGHSIAYPAAMITDPYIPRVFCCAFYTALTTLPFIISSCKRIRLLGIIVFIAAVIGYRFYSHAFISVWCFFAALLSLYIFFVIRNMETAADRNTPAEIRDPG